MPDLITLSEAGAGVVLRLAAAMPSSNLYFHESVKDHSGSTRFIRTMDLVKELFPKTGGIVFVGPCGVIVRALAPHIQSKLSDPPVVVVDVHGRYSISLLSGHEGGANTLALAVSNILGAEPVITTTSEAARRIIVGVGCRKGCAAENIVKAVSFALGEVGMRVRDVRFLASADIKRREKGLIQAAAELGIALRFISSDEIRACSREFSKTLLAMEKVNLPAVAEPAALLAGRRTTLILRKIKQNGVTVAVARENSL
jgi:cobalt-precorrin 5A hydrolase